MPGSTVRVTLQVGHDQTRQRSQIPRDRILRFDAIGSNGDLIDLRGALNPGDRMDDGHFQLTKQGTYILAMETDNHARSQLPATRFNDYIKVEGLSPALMERARTARMEMEGSEIYSRNAKSIIQVGPSSGATDADIGRPAGLPLEIVPLKNPYADPRPKILPVRVLYHGQKLPGALVKLTNLELDAAPIAEHVTDNDGKAQFIMPQNGYWHLNVIWTKPLPSSYGTDFETVFSSLSFGYR
jgi:uncharacterized GH25 family protein